MSPRAAPKQVSGMSNKARRIIAAKVITARAISYYQNASIY